MSEIILSTELLNLINIEIDDQKACVIKIAHTSNATQLRILILEKLGSLPAVHFLDSYNCLVNSDKEPFVLVSELLAKDQSTVRLTSAENISASELNSSSLTMQSNITVTTEISQSTESTPHELKLPFLLSGCTTSINKPSSTLNLSQWTLVFTNCNIFYGIRMDKETLKYASQPVLNFKQTPNCIPVFVVNDESYISAYMGNKLFESPFLAARFFDGGIDHSCPFIKYGVNVEYTKARIISDEKRMVFSTCSFNEPRVTLTLDMSYIEATPEFIKDIDAVLRLTPDKQKNVLKEVLSTYGHVYPTELALGGHLFNIDSHFVKGKDQRKTLTDAFDSFVTLFKTFAKVDSDEGNKEKSKQPVFDNNFPFRVETIGGDSTLLPDVKSWANTVNNSSLWRIIKQNHFQSVITLLSKDRQDAIKKIINPDDQSQETTTIVSVAYEEQQKDLHSHFNVASWCLPDISSTNTKPTTFKICVIPVWLKESKSNLEIQYPTNLPMDDVEACYVFDTLAKYRSVQNKENVVDFITHPFIPNVQSHETVVAMLTMFARSLGMQINFPDQSFSYEESEYRCACGVTDLASVFWINEKGGSKISTAKFTFILDISFSKVTMDDATIKDFVLSFIDDIATTLDCPPEYVRVFELNKCCTAVTFGLTTQDRQHTENLATGLRHAANQPFSNMRRVLHHTRPQDYPFEMTSVLTHLQLQQNDFDITYNRNFVNWPSNDSVQQRGSRPYYLPIGWYRHALRVIDKYGASNQIWLGMTNRPNEWSVAYHGTKYQLVRNIIRDGLHPGTGDLYRRDAVRMIGARADRSAIYLASHSQGGADAYATPFPLFNQTTREFYKIIFQCRLKPNTFTEHQHSATVKYLRVYDTDGVRPYGILLQKVSSTPVQQTNAQAQRDVFSPLNILRHFLRRNDDD